MNNFQAAHVVAIAANGEPILCQASTWNVGLDETNGLLKLKRGKHKLIYTLKSESIYFRLVDKREEISIGRTVGRMALTGIAASTFPNGKIMSGALMDFAVRGSEKNTILSAVLVMNDTTSIQFDATIDEFQRISSYLPAIATGSAAAEKARELIDLIDRMKKDGPRVLLEIDLSIQQLTLQLSSWSDQESVGNSFDIRDQARQRRRSVEDKLNGQKILRKAVGFGLHHDEFLERSMGRNNWSASLKIGVLTLAVIIGVVFLQMNTEKPSSNDLKAAAVVDAPQPIFNGSQAAPATAPEIDEKQNENNNIKSEEVLPLSNKTLEIQPEVNKNITNLGPSFDCVKAVTDVEKMICESLEISDADRLLDLNYRNALAISSDSLGLKRTQNEWRKSIRDTCANITCISQAYQKRNEELSSLIR
jgi:uncharacterized protein YecT (DUF1311 family)